MACIEVIGGERLQGEIEIQGSKNAVLPILAASVLNKGISKVNHCPKIQDVLYMIKLLEGIGCVVSWEEDSLIINAKEISSFELNEKYVTKVRASIILLGALLGRVGCGSIAYPGGCSIGTRPIDLHLQALKKMKVTVVDDEEHIYCQTNEITGFGHSLRFPSVGATENIILAAVLAKGITTIQNAAREPEVVSLCEFLIGMGAKIRGFGLDTIEIEGVEELHDTEYRVADDRIVAGTYLAAAIGTHGSITMKTDCIPQLDAVLQTFVKLGTKITMGRDYLTVQSPTKLLPIGTLYTQPYPGFPTDMQSQLIAVLTIGSGTCCVVENIFESRFHFTSQLMKLGANIKIEENKAYVTGKESLCGAEIVAKDLRGGAALVIGGVIAQGVTKIANLEFIERGYEDICNDLKILGANVRQIK